MSGVIDNTTDADEISVRDILVKLINLKNYLLSKWLIILVFALIGAGLGFAYAIFKKPLYTAESTFVIDDGSKSGGLGQYASLASLAGIDVGGGGGGIFQGDNILQLYKSRVMIEKALLSTVKIDGKDQLLIDRYIYFHQLKSKWNNNPQLSNITFSGKPENFNRKQDSIITNLVETFNKKLLTVTKIDKKLSIISVDVVDNDEIFAKEFNNKLVETVNNFYTQTKVKKSFQNVSILQKQADSVRRVLNNSISGIPKWYG